ncbi:hypothetical protein BC332_20614 [Capsicum chinense]|nr:hypothetical protein BC332_20614 [Capsicum chinense]
MPYIISNITHFSNFFYFFSKSAINGELKALNFYNGEEFAINGDLEQKEMKSFEEHLSAINGLKKNIRVDVTTTAEKHNMTVDNPSTASKDEEKVEHVSLGERKVTRLNVYIPINCGDEFHWLLAIVVLKERRILVYDSMSRRRRSGPSSEIQKLAKILPTYLDMSDFLDQKVRTDWSTIEAYRDKMANPFDVQYVDGIAQQTIGSL